MITQEAQKSSVYPTPLIMHRTQASLKPQYPQPPVLPPYPAAAAAGTPQYPQSFPTQGGSTAVEWSTGLCDCCADPCNCCITCWCPCVTFGQIAEVVDGGITSCVVSGTIYCVLLACFGIPCIYSSYYYRTKLRNPYSLKGSSCGDCLTHSFCDSCALCQEYRELKIRGTDPSIGWQGNVQKWNRVGSTMPPPAAAVVPGMIR